LCARLWLELPFFSSLGTCAGCKGSLPPCPCPPYLEEQNRRKKGWYVQTHLDTVGFWFLYCFNTIVGTQV
jgi:hypothetical protein